MRVISHTSSTRPSFMPPTSSHENLLSPLGTVERIAERVPQNSRSGQRSMQLLGLALPPLRFKSCMGEVEPPPLESQSFAFHVFRNTIVPRSAEGETVPKAKSVESENHLLRLASAKFCHSRRRPLPRPLLLVLGAHGRALRSSGDLGSDHGLRG